MWGLAFERSVVLRATRIALIVGTVLALINHGNTVVMGAGNLETWIKIALTYAVPYCVSTYSSVSAVRDRERMLARQDD
ncbi:MAG: nitrate/nitrite transporter NrtS [Pseudomonadota bacterium]